MLVVALGAGALPDGVLPALSFPGCGVEASAVEQAGPRGCCLCVL